MTRAICMMFLATTMFLCAGCTVSKRGSRSVDPHLQAIADLAAARMRVHSDAAYVHFYVTVGLDRDWAWRVANASPSAPLGIYEVFYSPRGLAGADVAVVVEEVFDKSGKCHSDALVYRWWHGGWIDSRDFEINEHPGLLPSLDAVHQKRPTTASTRP